MMNSLKARIQGAMRQLAVNLKFYGSAVTIYDIHSPSIYRFISFVGDTSRHYYKLSQLRGYASYLANNFPDNQEFDDVELKETERKKKPHSIKPAWSSLRMLYRALVFKNPKTIVIWGGTPNIETLVILLGASSKCQMYIYSDCIAETEEYIHRYTSFGQKTKPLADIAYYSMIDERVPEQIDLTIIGLGTTISSTESRTFAKLEHRMKPNSMYLMLDVFQSKMRIAVWTKLRRAMLSGTAICFYRMCTLHKELTDRKDIHIVPLITKPWRIGLWGQMSS